MPSSLERVLSHASGFSPCLPVLVCGTYAPGLLRGFSRQCGFSQLELLLAHLDQLLSVKKRTDLPTLSTYQLQRTSNTHAQPILLRHPIVKRPDSGAGILTSCPSPTSFDLGLGTTNPGKTSFYPGTLRLSADVILTHLIATHACIITSILSTASYDSASTCMERSPTTPEGVRGFGINF